ncbi:MAG: aspartyl protease family protein [Chitinophagaceae bacterium]|nr:aspartyl protease family protein [Chitinophagaceae bacterium]MCW5904011.1 aspartyl protease family protein [Chitinophagaceae bacterium]
MLKKIFISLSLFIFLKGFAQEEFVPPQAKFIAKFPFTQLIGGLIMIQASVDTSTTSLNFLLDTGSGGISLDSSTVERLGFVTHPTERQIRGIAGVRKVPFTYGHYLNFTDFATDTFSFHINNYALLSSVYGTEINGVIGFSFLRRYIVKIDYDNQQIEIYSPGTFKYPRNGYLIKPSFSTLPLTYFTLQNNHKIVNRYIFDTGAGLCFLLNKEFVEDNILLKKNQKVYKTQAEGLGGKIEMGLALIKQVHIGPYKFKDVPVYIFEDEFNATSYPHNAGIIGNDLLRRFNVILNYPDKEIHIKPNSKFSDAFDYSYTGLNIYLIENNIVVGEVVKGSPADKAGFIEGDIIVAVDNNFSNNIQLIKMALQNVGSSVQVVVSRGNKIQMLILEVVNILH